MIIIISIIKLGQHGDTPLHPVIGGVGLVDGQVDREHEVSRMSGGREGTCSFASFIQRTFIELIKTTILAALHWHPFCPV